MTTRQKFGHVHTVGAAITADTDPIYLLLKKIEDAGATPDVQTLIVTASETTNGVQYARYTMMGDMEENNDDDGTG